VDELVEIRGTIYAVRSGSVTALETSTPPGEWRRRTALQLAYAKAVARRSPIIALPGTEPKELKSAVKNLEEVREQLASIQKNPIDERVVREALYPTRYLNALADVERARMLFLERGNGVTARTYMTAERHALAMYEYDLRSYKRALLLLIGDMPPFATPGHIVTPESFVAEIERLQLNADMMRESLAARAACVRGFVHHCSADDLLLPEIADIETESGVSPLARSTHTAFADASDVPITDTRLFVMRSACTNSIDGGNVFGIYPHVSPVGTLYTRWELVGNALFLPSATDTNPYLVYFAEQNVPYVFMSPMIFYECPILTHDTGTLYAIRNIAALAAESPLSVFVATNNNLREIEQRLQNEIVREQDARAYIRELYRLKEVLPADVTDRIIELGLQLSRRSANLDELLDDIARVEHANLRLLQNVELGFNAEFLLYTRSGFGMLFFSRTPGDTPSFRLNDLPREEQPFVYLSEIGDHSMIQNALRFHHELFN